VASYSLAAAAPEILAAIASDPAPDSSLSAALSQDPIMQALAASEHMRHAGMKSAPLLENAHQRKPLPCEKIRYSVDSLRDLGPGVSPRDLFGAAMKSLTANDIARLIALVAGALPAKCDLNLSLEKTGQHVVLRSLIAKLTTWSDESEWLLIKKVIEMASQKLTPERVAEALDTADILIAPDGGCNVLKVFLAFLRQPFPVSVLCRVWCNREHAQLPLLLAGILLAGKDSNLLAADQKVMANLIKTLLQLSRLGHMVSCSATLRQAVVVSPGPVIVALCVDRQTSKLKKQLLTALVCDQNILEGDSCASGNQLQLRDARKAAIKVLQSGDADMFVAALARRALSPMTGKHHQAPLVCDLAAANYALGVITVAGMSLWHVFYLDARFGLCLAALNADLSGDTGALVFLLNNALGDAVTKVQVVSACLEFSMQDGFSGRWRAETCCAILSTLRNHVFGKLGKMAKTAALRSAIADLRAERVSRAEQSISKLIQIPGEHWCVTSLTNSAPCKLKTSMISVTVLLGRVGTSIMNFGEGAHGRLLGGSPAAESTSATPRDGDMTQMASVLQLDDHPLLSLSSTGYDQQKILAPADLRRSFPGAALVETVGSGIDRPLCLAELMPTASDIHPAVAPSEIVLDCVHMVFNNVSHSNLEAKVKDIAPLLHEEHFGWFANYLVVKRISTQPNFHSLYLAFLEKLGADDSQQKLLRCVITAVFHNIAKLLRSSKITTSTSERSLLKNLGSWLGQITLARNRPILQRQLDVKELLYQGYESGRLIAICPFVAKILEGAKSSVVFRPPNPWLVGLMAVLRDLYDVEDLKMNIKFEIEVLAKHLGIKLDEITDLTALGSRLAPIKDRSPDFNVKRVIGDAGGDSTFTQGLPGVATSAQRPPLVPTQPQGQTQQVNSEAVGIRENQHSARMFTPAQSSAGQTDLESTPQVQGDTYAEQTVIPNLASYITISAQVTSGPAGASFLRITPVAVDRAIREIIQPVVERSVTIACITTKELVAKDFATEPDESRVRKAAQLMVSNLAGSLALVTCKEPLRISIAKHLRSLLAQQLGPNFSGGDQHEQHAIQTCAAENLDLGCMLIEKAATEKAIRDVDDSLIPALSGRQKRFEQSHVLSAYASQTGRYPSALPEALRPKASGLMAHQFYVYESFQRIARQPNLQQSHPTQQSAIQQQQSGNSHRSRYHAPQLELSHHAKTNAAPSQSSRGGSATLSIAAQQAAAERPSISIAELMEAYRSATAKLDSEFASLSAKMQGATSEITFVQLRNHPISTHVNDLLLAAARVEHTSRDDAALAIAQSTFKAMCEQRALEPPVRLETLAIVLASVADISAHLVRDEVANWIAFLPARSEADRFLHAHVLVRLLGVELLDVAELDAYLARNMDGGRSQAWLDIALGFVELSVAQYHLATFPADLQRIARVLEIVARHSHPPPALRRLVATLSSADHSRVHHQSQQHHRQQPAPPPQAARQQSQQQERRFDTARSIAAAPGKVSRNSLDDLRSYGRLVSMTATARELRLASLPPKDPIGAREQVTMLLEQWIRVWNDSPGSEKAYAQYLALLQQHSIPRSDQSTERFVRLSTIICVESCAEAHTGEIAEKGGNLVPLVYSVIDAYAKLLILLVKYAVPDANMSAPSHASPQRLELLNRVLSTLTRVLIADYDATAERGGFDQRPYFRLLLNLLQDLNVPDPVLDSSNASVLAAFATALHALQPAVAPGFAFSWLELVSHRMLMPNLLLAKSHKGWILMHRLLVDLFVFLEPYLRQVQLSDAVRLLYKGTLRVLLVLLHDFPEFLSDYHFSFCDVIPSSCIQLRNLFLSAFPRSMRLPDPFTPNLKVDLLPEISQPPRILSNCVVALQACGLRDPLDEYLQTRHPISFLLDLPRKLQVASINHNHPTTLYNVPLVNSLVVHVGTTAIAQLHAKSGNAQQPITHSTPMDVFQHLMNNLDSEGRYFLLNAIANQLRYPNNHTHYFSCVLLYLFAEATSEYIQEQVTRVLLERLIVHRPHPWGLLITFIELIKNPRYSFWSHSFTHCATEIERVFESVARSCMGPSHLSNLSSDATP